MNEEDVKGSKKDRLIKGILRLVEEYLPVATHDSNRWHQIDVDL